MVYKIDMEEKPRIDTTLDNSPSQSQGSEFNQLALFAAYLDCG